LPSKAEKAKADELFKSAYNSYYSSIYKFCLSRLKNDRDSVEDCVQETFLVLYKKYLSGENVEYVLAFLFKTASNFIKKQYSQLEKKKKQVDLEEIKEIPSQSEDIDDRLTFEEYSRQISDALNDLDAQLFSLRYIEELKIEDIANRTGMSIANVTTRLSRIRKKLRDIFEKDYFK
jgi:RNA polymerase sigma-70 factor (ECF subfamily)